MAKIKIFDTTLRDGEQSPGVNLNLAEKLVIAEQLEKLNVDIIEAGFPAASKGDFQSVQQIARTIKNSSVTGLARAVTSDIDTAWEALKDGAEPRIHVFLATSPIHRQYKLKLSKEQVVERYITPNEYGEVFQYLKNNVPSIDKVSLSTHCHDDLGMATANSLAAIENGATQVECTINGIGERAGNASMEEIVVALHIRNDHYQERTRINLKEISRSSSLVSELTGMVVPGNKAIVGRNAYAHESGIHQDGVLKEKTTYEIISPELVGYVNNNNMVLGKHSGSHAFKTKLQELELQVKEEDVKNLFIAFKDLADHKKEISDEDIIAIVLENKLAKEEKYYELVEVKVQHKNDNEADAVVKLSGPKNELIIQHGTGSGSVEALYNTLEMSISGQVTLNDYRIQSLGAGRDALAQVFVRVQYDQKESTGRGLDQDVLIASAKAYINAINRAILAKEQFLEKV